MSEREVERIEKIAYADVSAPNDKRQHKRTLRRILHWQRRIWKASQS